MTCSIGEQCGACIEEPPKNLCPDCNEVHVLPRFDSETNTHRMGSPRCDFLIPDELVWHSAGVAN